MELYYNFLLCFVGILIIGMLIGILIGIYSEFKYRCKINSSFEENKNAKHHVDFKLVSSEVGFFNDSGFTIGYDYCCVYYCLHCGVVSHWNKGKISASEYYKLIKNDSNSDYIKSKLNKLIIKANKKYGLNRKTI